MVNNKKFQRQLQSLVIILILVSIAGALWTFSPLSNLARFLGITGGATSGTGYVNFTTQSNVAIVVSGFIDFGTGYVNSSRSFANLSSIEAFTPATGWINTSAPWDASQVGILINNTGNTVANLTFSANQSVSAWLGGYGADARITPALVVESDLGEGVCTGNVADLFVLQINTTEQALCSSPTRGLGFNFTNLADEMEVGVNLLLPSNVLLGQRSITLTFTATGNQ